MLFSDRLEIAGVLEALSPLHVGTGEDREGTELGERGAEAKQPRVATVVRDCRGLPCLPGSTVKGVLRAIAGNAAATPSLFGTIKDDGTGSMGRLHCFTAPMHGGPPATGELPYGRPDTGIFVACRTRIDRASGTASDAHLYAQEMVAPGARFALRLRVLAPEGLDAELALLAGVLAELQAPDGVGFGKGQAAGQGRLRLLSDSLDVTRYRLGADGRLAPGPFELPAPSETGRPAAMAKRVRLRLECPGPFLVIDSAHSQAHARREGRGEEAQIVGLRRPDGQPMLYGTGLMGVLRARAAWLAALDAGGALQDDPDRRLVPEGPTPAGAVKRATDLTPVERLFGVTGWRGLVRLAQLELVAEAQPVNLTSVKIDRFSGGPVDNALFTTRAFLGTAFDVELTLERRGGAPRPEDEALFDQLIESLEDEGPVLGHGGNKGFGWFEVSRHDG